MALSEADKDERLTQFLSMTEDRVDIEVAQNLLEACGWSVQAAVEQLYGGPASPGQSRPNSAMPTAGPPEPGRLGPRVRGPFLGEEDMQTEEDEDDVFMGDGVQDTGRGHRDPEGGVARPPPDTPVQHEMDDAQLAAAIEASYRAQTHAGLQQSEEELLAQALRISQQEEESRQRQHLLKQQQAELEESLLMDQIREQQEHDEREAVAAAEQARVERERREAAELLEQQGRAAAELEAKRARIPDEPAAGEPGRRVVLVKLPNGQRLQRAFRSTEAVGLLYDYVELNSQEVLAGQRFLLVETRPRKVYEDRRATLAEAGLEHQSLLNVEVQTGP